MSKVPKTGNSLHVCNILRKFITTAFVFYCDAKHSDTLQGFSNVCYYLFLGGCGQKWARPFISWSSKICCISRDLVDEISLIFLDVGTNLGKLNVVFIIISWEFIRLFRSYGALKSRAS